MSATGTSTSTTRVDVAEDGEARGEWSIGESDQRSLSQSKAFSSEVETGSRRENASNQESRAPFRFNRNGKGSRITSRTGPAVRPGIEANIPACRGGSPKVNEKDVIILAIRSRIRKTANGQANPCHSAHRT
ncbi:MAG: hypothetical protein E8A46_07970 [Bradyrhizobium sp.]|nr:MAG: hypothetical protein E8A46_07970 [Bradyrhizobium sp.]